MTRPGRLWKLGLNQLQWLFVTQSSRSMAGIELSCEARSRRLVLCGTYCALFTAMVRAAQLTPIQAAPCTWADTGRALESACEMALIGKAAIERNVGQHAVRIRQQAFRLFNTMM